MQGYALLGHASDRADGQPRGGDADRGEVGGNGPAQAGRAWFRPASGRLGARLGAPCLRSPSNDLAAIGRTNDAVLYGARVVLYVSGDDRSLEEIGPRVPSSASKDHGEPFAAIFARYNNDFYAVDPHLFSPAEIVFQNVETGRSHAFGRVSRRGPGPLVLGPERRHSQR